MIAFTLAAALLLVTAAPSPAPVAPRDCHYITVKDKRYKIKADQIRCKRARTWARRYLRTHVKPSGYQCRDFGSETKLKFRCSKGIRVFFAIRR